jgi:2',3'-cyclic-nucleotide 2'-phosphodiesterase (5'-nucleotidase family)
MLALLLLLSCRPPEAPAAVRPVTLTFVAMNDFHGALYEKPVPDEPTRATGGLPWLVSAVEALRAEDPDLVLLDGGDSFQGDWPVNATKGEGSVRAFELLGVDVAAVGNHEFDYGLDALEAAAKTRTQWVAANITRADGTRWSPEGVRPWAMVERKGVKVAVIGLSTTETPQTTVPKNVETLRFHDVVETVRGLIPEIEAAGADVTVVVGHLTGSCKPKGYVDVEPCTPDGEIGRLVTELPPGAVDLIVAGHAHTVLATRVGDTFVLEDRAQGGVLGRLDLVVGPGGAEPDASVLHPPWPLVHDKADPGCEGGAFPTEPRDVGGRSLAPSPKALALIDELEARTGDLCEPVGCSATALQRERHRESAVGDVVADAMLAAFPDAHLAVQNSGGLRADLPAGTLRREHAQAVMPFDNRTMLVELTGAQVIDMFRIGSSGAHGVLQVAGASYGYDPARTQGSDRDGDGAVADWEKDRLCAVADDGAPIDPKGTYRVVTSDFLFAGGDHLGPAFQGARVLAEGPLVRDALLSYLRSRGETCLGADGPVLASDAPRITVGACR